MSAGAPRDPSDIAGRWRCGPAAIEGRVERLRRIAPVVDAANGANPVRDLSVSCATVLSVSGASLMVVVDRLPSPLSSSDHIAARLEEIQHTLGEGPSLDAHIAGRPVGEPDLARPRPGRWTAFGPAAFGAGAGAVFSFPLRIGSASMGALTLYRSHPGDLSAGEYTDAQAVAGVVAHAIIAVQAQAEPGTLSPELSTLAGSDAALHQASGMVSVQLEVGVGDALVRIRAHAFAANRPLADVAADVVTRRLRFND